MDKQMNDYSDNFRPMRNITNASGINLMQFIATLKPDYLTVWLSISLAYAALAVCYFFMINIDFSNFVITWLAIFLASIWIGWFVAYLSLFLHEAVHFNIAKEKKMNDLLANIFIGLMVGQDVRLYRPIHMKHHVYLGTTNDTERSYFNALTPIFLLKSLSGIYALEVIKGRFKDAEATKTKRDGNSYFNWVTLSGIILHMCVILTALLFNNVPLALSWIVGVFLMFPFFGAVRQLLEHRSEDAAMNVDYTVTAHGAMTRNFGHGFFARMFGGAGFNLHLLHHWLPNISYTCFNDVEKFILQTELAPILRERNSSYLKTFKTLLFKNI
jgi:fatty acid desaturase